MVYNKNQLLIPNSLADIKKGEASVAISNFSNESKRIKAGTMVGFYEKLKDDTKVLRLPNIMSNETKTGKAVQSESATANCGSDEVCATLLRSEEVVIGSETSDGSVSCKSRGSNVSDVKTVGKRQQQTDKCISMELGEVMVGVTLTESQKKSLKTMLTKFIKRFAFNPQQVGRTQLIEHEINTGNAKPVRRGPYKCSIREQEIIRQQVNEYLEMGILSRARSP
jgi:hypothetical protein